MVQYRKMTVDDYDQAYQLWSNTPGMHLQSLDNSKSGIARVVNHNPDLCFVAEDDGKLIATIIGATDGRKGYLYHVAVDKEYQGQHVGSHIIKLTLDAFKQQEIVKIGLFTVVDNIAGQEFWQHLGFSERPDIKYFDIDL